MTPHDAWDYDGVNENGALRPDDRRQAGEALTHFDRNGFGYTLDRTNGKVLVANPYGPMNWAKTDRSDDGPPG